MELEERVSELERRLEALVGDHPDAPRPTGADFWALEGLKQQLSGAGVADGGVLYTGAVRLPTGERYEWQYGALTEQLLEGGEAGDPGEPGADWSDAAESFAALGHPVRLRLLREILGGRRTAAELAALDETGTTGQIYHHLRQLTGAGWLHTTGRGRYEVPGVRVVPLLVVLTAARS
ncbi:helix-turn-helix domain-containing protein [Streptomyces sp. NBC_01260]|uniref:ArsR/SmtB family transcription factor n=1 Tax=unclassified Streptomyces TaxID=2593676 RepID=UPI000F46BD25|nr:MULTISPECIES: helix-turn-helix domain-containing protein [unclassified Streptomyces]MCX4771073.1 helix-turn-helix domain-containing protein [Streptomyces sp. NBC_01285]ROQ81540.1 helix-turn-helix protein [Streptomyces sp. CEV 2-1]RPK47370.1 Helix-turn-helix domain protein [Streptomyces sp. ADI92-24]